MRALALLLALLLVSAASLPAQAQRVVRDPFAPLVRPVELPPGALPQQAAPVSDYRLAGVMTDGDTIAALVEAPDGATFVLEPGDYLGENWGVIVSVEAQGALEVREEFETPLGDRVVETHRLAVAAGR